MYLVVNKTMSLNGKAIIPGSKSQSVRGMLFALLAKGKSRFFNVLNSDDTQTAIHVCRTLGAQIDFQGDTLALTSHGLLLLNTATEINTGNSGITTRFILPILGLRENYSLPILVNCGDQMQERPIKHLIDALRTLGMHIQYVEKADRFPILVTGQLKGGVVEVDGITSQYLSALLISLPCAQNDSVITVINLNERPYVEMTLAWLKQQKIKYEHQKINDQDVFYIKGGQQYQAMQIQINGDFSSASCLIAAGVLFPGAIELHGLDMEDPQGDKELIAILQKMGADIIVEKEKIKIFGNKKLTGIAIDANSIPDLLPALAVIATQAAGKTKIYNVKQARIKETDRIHSMTEGLKKMGAKIEEHADGMTIYQSDLQGAVVQGYGDHRTVMALTIAGMLGNGTSMISDEEAISKTYPGFVDTIKSLGANVIFSKEKFSSLSLPTLTLPSQREGRESRCNHIVLFGFKHVGKTSVGKQLASALNKKFIDLDHEIEKFYEINFDKHLTCRQIAQQHGEPYFREQEQWVLQYILQLPSGIIALGGGTLHSMINQEMVKSHLLLHITAPRDIVFQRIMLEGIPAFFDPQLNPQESFNLLWDTRNEIYKKLTPYVIENNLSIDAAVKSAVSYIQDLIN